MQFQKKEKRQTTVRFDSHHVRLRTGEVQRKTGSYMYRWTDKLGKRNTIYAATLEDLREQEEQILVDQHDGIKANIKNVTVNDVYELWCQLKRGIKDSTMKNYIYMYELFVKPTFGKKKLVQVKKSDVRRFYNQLIDDKVLKPSIFLRGEKQTVSNGIEQDGSMAWMQHRPQMRIRPLFADIGILRMAIANTNTRGPSLEKMRTSLPIMVPELLP